MMRSMTGAGSKAMTSSKRVIQHISFWLGILLIGNASMTHAAEATADVEISVTFIAPTCELNVPTTVILNPMINGVQEHTPFDIQVACNSQSKTSIFAQTISGTLADNNTVLMTGLGSVGSGARFSLRESGQNITLNGETGVVFCNGVNARSCTLTPSTEVKPDTPRGIASAIIRFNIRYEA